MSTVNSRLPWTSYFCTSNLEETQNQSSFEGYIRCPICYHHYDNCQFIKHSCSHMLVSELFSGTGTSFEFCAECMNISGSMTMAKHREVHRHVERLKPLQLLNGNFVCPICETCFPSIIKFATHLYERHVYHDAPYLCTICFSFRSSYYCELLSHFELHHRKTNHIFCPYCLKHFELPIHKQINNGLFIFSAREFYDHVRQHWDQTTYRCDSCRLDFVKWKDHKLHDYLHHSGDPIERILSTTTDENSIASKNQLTICQYSNIITHAPRFNMKCLECGETLRQPLSKHFLWTLKCSSCSYSSSCLLAVNWHWSTVHCALPLENSEHDSKLEQVRICTTSPKDSTGFTQESCGAAAYRTRRCKKHAPPGIYSKGVLKCECGFRTIVCDQMTRHLVTEGHSVATQDDSQRISLFYVKKGKGRALKTSLWWSRKMRKTPKILKSVGLY